MEFEELKRVRTLYNGIVVVAATRNTDCKYDPLKKVSDSFYGCMTTGLEIIFG